jgi:hypothetical protein
MGAEKAMHARWVAWSMVALTVFGLGLTRAEDEARAKLREAIRAKIEQLAPKEQAKALQQMRERAERNLDQRTLAVLPKNVNNIKPQKVDGQTFLKRLPQAPKGPALTPEELDRLLPASASTEFPATDEVLIRRLYLDLIGRLPSPADLQEFQASADAGKVSALVDRLLALPQFGQRWGKYWSDVVRYRATNQQANRLVVFNEVDWLAEKFNANRPWSEIATEILTATGIDYETPEAFFVACHDGEAAEMAGEAARIFLGTQVACAQCHDHPYDPWKRDQFHELAAFFGKTDFRPRKDLAEQLGRPIVLEVSEVLIPAKQYRKPDLQDPSKPGEFVQPVFLTGQPLPMQTSDAQRREALADFVTSPQNPYFARAFVNRMWTELVGYGFVEPVDDLGSNRPIRQEKVFNVLARSFASSDYNVKALIRTIVLSSAYRRSISQEGSEEAPARMPTRLSSGQLFASLEWVLGPLEANSMGRQRGVGGPRRGFESTFGYDPSTPDADIEGTIPQTLALMNNAAIESRVRAQGAGNLLAKLLVAQPADEGLADMLYQRVLGRKPSADERATCIAHLTASPSRAEGAEDILWALLNSAEFLHQH